MTQLSKISFGVLLVGALFANAPRPACAGWIYVGSWDVSDGPSVDTNPIVYSAVEYAAVRFGGVGSDYQISSISPGVSRTPNRMAWYAGWGDSVAHLLADTYRLDTGNGGYDSYVPPVGGTKFDSAFSAYVQDSIGRGYRDYAFRFVEEIPTGLAGDGGPTGTISDPEPSTIIMGLTALGFSLVASYRCRMSKSCD